MKLFAALALSLALTGTPVAASATSEVADPGPLDIENILSSSYHTDPDAYDLFLDDDNAFTDEQEATLEFMLNTLATNYNVSPLVEVVNSFGDYSGEDWVAKKSKEYGVTNTTRSAIYLVISKEDRELWISNGGDVPEALTDDRLELIIGDYLVPYVESRGFLAVAAMGVESVAREYQGLPLISYEDHPWKGEPAANTLPAPEPTVDTVAPESSDGAGQTFGALLLLVLSGILLLIPLWLFWRVIRASHLRAKLEKKEALASLENLRLERFADELVLKLRDSPEYLTAKTREEREGYADKASFTILGFKQEDKRKVFDIVEARFNESS